MRRRFLLWDHDGVLVDTERWYFAATRDALAPLNVELSQQRYLELMAAGRACWDLAREQGVPAASIEVQRAERDARYRELLQTEPIEVAGVREVLAELAPRHRMAVITNSRRRDFDLIHAGRDLLEHFEFVLTIEDYARAKPQPDPYLAGLARFGAPVSEALALEDSARGLASACAAGLDCLVIRSAFTVSQDFSAAWRVVYSVLQLPELLASR